MKSGTKRAWWTRVAVASMLGFVVLIAAILDDRDHRESDVPPAAAPAATAPRLPSEDPPVGEAAIALLGGLHPGDDVVGWKVRSITHASEQDVKNAISVWLEKDGRSFVVWVAVKGRLEHTPVVETKGYGLYFGRFLPPEQNQGDDEIHAVLDAIAGRVRDNESKTAAAGLL